MKENASIERLCLGLPCFFLWFLEYARGLSFDESPDYELIEEKINAAFVAEVVVTDANEVGGGVIDFLELR